MPIEQYESPEEEPDVLRALFTVGIVGLHAARFWKEKKEKIKDTVGEAKEDVKRQPFQVRDIISGAVANALGIGLEYIREEKEGMVAVQSKKLSSIRRYAIERGKLDLLDEFGEIQEEAIEEVVGDVVSGEGPTLNDEEKKRLMAELGSEEAREAARQGILKFIEDRIKGRSDN
ncbi:MAG: hypothetical protein WD883_00455 [Candidatus Colwellbacteria bacterium]